MLFFGVVVVACLLQPPVLNGQNGLATGGHEIGYVVAIDGDWVVKRNSNEEPLYYMSSLHGGDQVHIRVPMRGQYAQIAVASFCLNGGFTPGQKPPTRKCSVISDGCKPPIILPQTVSCSDNSLRAFFTKAKAAISKDERKLAKTSGYGGLLQDDIVELSEGKIDVSRVFEHKSRGDYAVTLERVGGGEAARLSSIGLSWPGTASVRAGPIFLETGSIQPGLYGITTQEEKADEHAWVLVQPPDPAGQQAREELRRIEGEIEKWGPEINTPNHNTKASLIRAYLAYLAALPQSR